MSTPTLHNSAGPEDFARTVLMPGDPLRARFIAETYLENARLVNDVRGIQGYTGEYKGKRVSVMASGNMRAMAEGQNVEALALTAKILGGEGENA